MKEFNKNLNGGIAHLKPFPGSKAKQMDHHAIPILKEHQYDAAVIHVGINDLLKSRTNLNVSEIAKDIIIYIYVVEVIILQQVLFLVLFTVLKFLTRKSRN